MSIYLVNEKKCTGCLRCLRMCPVQAVRLEEQGVSIDAARCIDCGLCRVGCSHGAVYTPGEVDAVKKMLAARRKVILSVDPACIPLFPAHVTMEKLAAAAQKLGFWDTADMSEAVMAVAMEYAEIAREGKLKNILLSECPVVQELAEKYYPDLLESLAPVASPMVAHGRMLKRDFTSAAVVYVGPCSARKGEAKDVRHSTEANAVLTFEELLAWCREAGVDPAACDDEPLLSACGGEGLLSPLPGGMLRCIDVCGGSGRYEPLEVDGISSCLNFLEELRQGTLTGCLVELNACSGGCLGRSNQRKKAEAASNLRRMAASAEPADVDTDGVAMANPAISRAVAEYVPSEEQIQRMLRAIGISSAEKQHNCGACGFRSCREKALAVLAGREEQSICRVCLRELQVNLVEIALDELPAAAIAIDDTQRIVFFNREAERVFEEPKQTAMEQYVFELMDPAEYQYVLDTGLPIRNRRMNLADKNLRVEANLVPMRVKERSWVLGIFKDITEQETEEARQVASKLQSVEMAQRVIDKQMTVAQQIAYLLGETTAETKVTLNQLKQQILGEEADQ